MTQDEFFFKQKPIAADGATDLPFLTGGCLCGTVRYRAQPNHREGYYCHCRMCQLAFGNTRAAFLNLRKVEVEWTQGTPTYFASSSFTRRGFCGRCGTPLCFIYLESERMDLSIGSFDDPSALEPAYHFSIESVIVPWHARDGVPGQRGDANQGILDRWKKSLWR